LAGAFSAAPLKMRRVYMDPGFQVFTIQKKKKKYFNFFSQKGLTTERG